MKILYILPSYNLYGGTPRKTLNFLRYYKEKSSVYVYSCNYIEFKPVFEDTGAFIYEGNHKKNVFAHLFNLLHIIDNQNIEIIQTHFTMGELLGYFIKKIRPNVKLLVSFEGPFRPKGAKRLIGNIVYNKVDAFIYVSNYVREEKHKQFPLLALNKNEAVIHNGTSKREPIYKSSLTLQHPALLDVAGLVDWKNAEILIRVMNIIVNKFSNKKIFLYLVGEGAERKRISEMINNYSLQENIFLLGYQSNIGSLLQQCDVFVHPAYKEGFGIAVIEAMLAGKPAIVADAGALPEIVEHGESGFRIAPFDTEAWVDTIFSLLKNDQLLSMMGTNAQRRAERKFSIDKCIDRYNSFYLNVIAS